MKTLIALGLSALSIASHAELSRQEVSTFFKANLKHILSEQAQCGDQFAEGLYLCGKDQPGQMRVNGSWDSMIVPKIMNIKNPVRFLDSNMFVTANVLYPLWFVDVDPAQRSLSLDHARDLAIKSINVHRRFDGFSFWVDLGASMGAYDRIGPLNLSTLLMSSQIKTAERVGDLTHMNTLPADASWITNAFKDRSTWDALFSVPNDADDTALGIISNYYDVQRRVNNGDTDALESLREVLSTASVINDRIDTFDKRHHRQVKANAECERQYERMGDDAFRNVAFIKNCSLDDPREFWKADSYRDSYSGAYMTWLYDETENTYAHPEKGAILTGQNSVDCVVVANALYAISVSGLKSSEHYRPAYENSCRAITNVILDSNDQLRKMSSGRKDGKIDSVWKFCGLFYPAHMTFPYMLSRAVADAKACTDLNTADQTRFDKAMGVLTSEILKEQDSQGRWFETMDQSYDLSTALALNSIQSFQSIRSIQTTQSKTIQSSTEKGLRYLIAKHATQRGLEGGTFFGGGVLNDVALWQSTPFAHAMALEAAGKFLRGTNATHLRIDRDGNVNAVNNAKAAPALFNEKNLSEFIADRDLQNEYHERFVANAQTMKKELVGRPDFSRINANLTLAMQNTTNSEVGHIIGVDMSIGEHYRSNDASVAYYWVKFNAKLGVGVNGDLVHESIQAKFLGVSSKANIIETDVGVLPITFINEKNITSVEGRLMNMSIAAPIVMSADQSKHLDVIIVGSLIGHTFRQIRNVNETVNTNAFVPVDFDMGLSAKFNQVISLQVKAGTSIEMSYVKSNMGSKGTFQMNVPYRAGVELKLSPLKRVYGSVGYSYVYNKQLAGLSPHMVNVTLGIRLNK